jgi:WhiB family redox-sensing transcriptional regulator
VTARPGLQWSDGAAGPVLGHDITPGWERYASCATADPEAWFPGKGESTVASRMAKQICKGCFVRTDCLEYALDNPAKTEFGIWGGASEAERRRLRPGRVA